MYIRRFFLTCLLFISSLQAVYAANLVFSPSTASYAVNKVFSVDLLITNNQDSINAVSAGFSFSSDTLELQSISKSGSIIAMWAEEPSFSNGTGSGSLEGIIFNPGFSGTTGKVVTLTFKAKKAGVGTVVLTSGSILANDGSGTNVVGSLGRGDYTISASTISPTPTQTPATPTATTPAKTTPAPTTTVPEGNAKVSVSSTSYPDQQAWYSGKNAVFAFNFPENVTSLRILTNNDPFSSPTKAYTPAITSKEFLVETDGVQYMHVQAKDASGWGSVVHYKFQVDSHAPININVTFPESTISGNPNPIIKVTAEDALSGLATVELVIDGLPAVSYPVNESNLYTLREQKPGVHRGYVYAKDKAGNSSGVEISFTVVEIKAPDIISYTKNAVSGEDLKVVGTTYPTTNVEVVYTDVKTDKIYAQSVISDAQGAFTQVWDGSLPVGVYEMKAHVIDGKGVTGAYTHPRTVLIEQKPYIAIGVSIINWLSLLLVLVVAIFCVAGAAWYSYTLLGRWKRRVVRKFGEDDLKTEITG